MLIWKRATSFSRDEYENLVVEWKQKIRLNGNNDICDEVEYDSYIYKDEVGWFFKDKEPVVWTCFWVESNYLSIYKCIEFINDTIIPELIETLIKLAEYYKYHIISFPTLIDSDGGMSHKDIITLNNYIKKYKYYRIYKHTSDKEIQPMLFIPNIPKQINTKLLICFNIKDCDYKNNCENKNIEGCILKKRDKYTIILSEPIIIWRDINADYDVPFLLSVNDTFLTHREYSYDYRINKQPWRSNAVYIDIERTGYHILYIEQLSLDRNTTNSYERKMIDIIDSFPNDYFHKGSIKLQEYISPYNDLIQDISPLDILNQDKVSYIYLIRPREFLCTNQEVYKLGRTTQCIDNHIKRLKNYTKGSEIVLSIQVSTKNVKDIETNIKNLFKEKYSNHEDGYEYFIGNKNTMKNDILSYIINNSYCNC